MAGILDYLGGGDPSTSGGVLGTSGGVLGAMPQMQPWQQPLGMFGSALKDAGAYLSGHPADANSAQQYSAQMQQYQRLQAAQQARAAAFSQDPATSQKGYSAMVALGMDPTPIQHMKAAQAMPQLLQNLQPSQGFNDNPVAVTPQVTANPTQAQQQATQTAQATNAAPAMSMQPGMSFSDALKNAPPELQSEMAPGIIQQQMQIAAKSVRPATLAQKRAGGYNDNDPVNADIYGNLTSPVKPQAEITQNQNVLRTTPLTPYQQQDLQIKGAEANKPLIVPMGSTLETRSGQVLGGQGSMPLAPGGKLSSNINDYPAQMQPIIMGMIKGTIAPPQGAALRAPQIQQQIAAAAAIDPSFDETKWTARNKMAGDAMGNGAWGKSMNALGTATQHVAALGNYATGTFNTTVPAVNWALNNGASALGSPGQSVYEDTAHKVGEEYTRAYRGAGGSESDIKSSMDALSPNASARSKDAVINENMNLARDKMAENVQQYNRTMGTNKKISDFVSPQTVAAYAGRGIDINTGNPAQPQGSVPVSPSQLPRIPSAAANPQDIVDELRKRGVVK